MNAMSNGPRHNSGAAELLAEVERAIARGKLEQALEHLLELWALTRDVSLARLIEALSERLCAKRPPVGALRPSETERAWAERIASADAVDLGVLLPSLGEVNSVVGRKQLELLARFPPDPRIAARLCELLVAPPFAANSTAPFWVELEAVVQAHADPRVVERLAAASPLRATLDTEMGARIDRIRARISEDMRARLADLATLEPELCARVEQIDRSLAPAERSLGADELLAAVLAEPGSLAHREVYADFLQARGDPRGEFVALQLAAHRGALSRAGARRMRALEREYAGVWLREISRALVRDSIVFERGFLVAARIHSQRRELGEQIGAPLWATVESLEGAPLELLRHPGMRSLRSITCDEATALALLDADQPLPSVERLCVDFVYPAVIQEPLRRSFEAHVGLPALRVLGLRSPELFIGQFFWIWCGELGARLERVELSLTWSRDHEPRERKDLGLGLLLRSLRESATTISTLVLEHRGLRWTLHRGEGSTWRQLDLRAGDRFDVDSLRIGLDDLLVLGEIELRADIELSPDVTPTIRASLAALVGGESLVVS